MKKSVKNYQLIKKIIVNILSQFTDSIPKRKYILKCQFPRRAMISSYSLFLYFQSYEFHVGFSYIFF